MNICVNTTFMSSLITVFATNIPYAIGFEEKN